MLKKSLQLVNAKLRLPTRRLFSQKTSSSTTRSFSSTTSSRIALVSASLVSLYVLSKSTMNKEALAEEVTTLPSTTTTTESSNATTTSTSSDNYHTSPELNPLSQYKLEELKITLYQYTACPFCCKVRAFLDYHKIPYTKVEVDPVLKTQLNFSKQYRKVPVVIVNDKIQLNDSSFIITCITDLMRRQGYKPPVEHDVVATPREEGEAEVQWRRWVDTKFVHTLAPNIYRTPKEAAEAFEYIMSQRQFSYLQQQAIKYAGSTVMYYVSKSLRKKHNIGDERQAIYDCGKTWMEAVGDKKFIGGNIPNLADLAAYGILTAIEDLTTFDDLVKNTKGLGEWFYRVKELVGDSSGTFDGDKQ